ncbi:MAG: carbohydrate kinase [Bacteroidota bacterium]
MRTREVICFGEILWDVFPDKQIIGGAPLNVALRLHSFNVEAAIISRIGTDTLGVEITSYITQSGLCQEFIQRDDKLPTGQVSITLNEGGCASYDILKPVAWDAIEVSSELIQAVGETPYFLFGSLAIRGGLNRETLRRLLLVANTKIFDVNLRAPHYHISMVYELMQLADFIKLNDEELLEVCDVLGCQEKNMKNQVEWLVKITSTTSVCVTRGDAGALLFHLGKFYEHDGFKVNVVDTVGAGDSFLATLIHYLFLKQDTPQNALKAACAVGAIVASKEGANAMISEKELQNFMHGYKE